MRGMVAVLLVAIAGASQADIVFTVSMDGAQVPTASTFTGSGTVTLNSAQTQITVALTHDIPNGNVINGHIHQGAVGVDGGVVFPFSGLGASPINDVVSISPAQVAVLLAGNYYVNIHTVAFGAGEIRGQILPPDLEPTVFTVSMDGAQVPTASTFTGSGTVTLNEAQTQITVALTHDIPNGNVINGHIHQGAIGVDGGVIFPFSGLGASPINDVISISPAQVAVLLAGNYYVNIHTVAFGAGEIRGQILQPDLDDLYVDFSQVSPGAGTPASPFNTLGAALELANSGAFINIAPGTSPEIFTDAEIVSLPLVLLNSDPGGGSVIIGDTGARDVQVPRTGFVSAPRK